MSGNTSLKNQLVVLGIDSQNAPIIRLTPNFKANAVKRKAFAGYRLSCPRFGGSDSFRADVIICALFGGQIAVAVSGCVKGVDDGRYDRVFGQRIIFRCKLLIG